MSESSDLTVTQMWRPGLRGPGREKVLGEPSYASAPFRARDNTLLPHPATSPAFAFMYSLMPNADVGGKDQWTEVPGGSMYDRLNDVSRDDWIETNTQNNIARWEYETITLGPNEVVTLVEVQADVLAFGSNFTMDIMLGDSTVAHTSILSSTDGIVTLKLAAPLTQAQVDTLRVQAIKSEVSGTTIVYSAPMRLYTRTDVWNGANAKFRANRDPTSGLSIAAGYLGSDVGPSVDLGGGRSWMTGGDAGFATAAGQQFWFGTNWNSPGAARTAFVRNHGVLLNSYDVEAATFTYHTGASNTPYYPDHGTYGGRWPFRHFIFSGRLFTVGRFSTAEGTGLVWMAYCDNFAGAPSTWTWTYMPPFIGLAKDRGNGEWGIWDDGAGMVYMWSAGPTPWTQSLSRVRAAAFTAGNWRATEWWTGSEWSTDRPGVVFRSPRTVMGRRRPRAVLYPVPTERLVTGQGSVHRRPDGRFQLVTVDDPFGEVIMAGLGHRQILRYALTAGTTPGQFGPLLGRYEAPRGEDYIYGASCHPHLTWPGKNPNDQVWSYASNWQGSDRQWEPLYFTRFIKVLAVDS